MILINISDISSLLSECKNMIPPPLMINMIIIRRTLRTWRLYIHTFIFIMYYHYYIMINMIIIRRTMRDRLLRSRTHFQRLGAIARFRDRFLFPKCLMPVYCSFCCFEKHRNWHNFPLSRFKMWVGLDIKAYRDSTPLQTSVTAIISWNSSKSFLLSFKLWNYDLLKLFQIFPLLLQIIKLSSLEIFLILFSSPWNYQLVLYSHWREQSCKTIDRVCFSCYNVCQWILKGEYSSWFNLGAKEFSSFVWCLGSFIDFLCAHAADTEGRDADSLVWLWQASHRF